MAITTSATANDLRQSAARARVVPDRRRYKRISVNLLGRFMRENKEEYPCRLVDVSVGGGAFQSPEIVDEGERIVAYFDEIGRLEGRVTRRIEGGFAIEIQATQYKREKIAAQLTWLANRNILGLPDDRRHERIVPKVRESVLKLPNGALLQCRVLDVSVSGASVAAAMRPELGTDVLLGRLRARVVRHHDQGIGLEFTDIQQPNALRRHFG
ncbi:MAG: PilZ domain-containing protein [Hyphomicrobiaceae bacterium]